MRRITGALVVMTVAAAVLGMRETAARPASQTSAARLVHLGVVVPDMDTAVREYVRVMGFPIPKVNEHSVDMPDGRKAQIKTAGLRMPNFSFELVQPVNAVGPFYDHLQAHGMSLQHLNLSVPGPASVDDLRSGFEQKGGLWTLGRREVSSRM